MTKYKVAALKNTKGGRSYGRNLATVIVDAESASEAHQKAAVVFSAELNGLRFTTDILCCDCDHFGVKE